MRIAIFGGTGYVGSHLVKGLLAQRWHPTLLVRGDSARANAQHDACTIVSGDIADAEAIGETLRGSDAAVYNIGILRESATKNVRFQEMHFDAAKRVMDIAAQLGVKRFLLMSANGVKADGTAYQRSKYQAEQYLATTDLEWTIFRPSVIFGEPHPGRMEFATQLLRDIVNSPLPAPLFFNGLQAWNGGNFKLSPVHVSDVASAFVNALRGRETIGRILSLGGPDEISWREVLATIAAAAGKRKVMLPAPAWGVYAAAAIMDRFDNFPITRDQLHMLMEGNSCSAQDLATMGITARKFDEAELGYLTNPAVETSPWQQNVV